MTRDQIIRAWKDEDYRQGLSAAELAQLPQHPAGAYEITDPETLGQIAGGEDPEPTHYIPIISYGCCGGITSSVACPSLGCLSHPVTLEYTCK